jgi:hypothetical protein
MNRILHVVVNEACGEELLRLSRRELRASSFVGVLRTSGEDEDGSVWIELDPSVLHTDTDHTPDQTLLVQRLDSEVQYLRQQLEQANERDREQQRQIIAALTSRIRELPAATSAHEGESEEPTAPVQHETSQPDIRPWWRGLFGE